jgi:hypothetical protein
MHQRVPPAEGFIREETKYLQERVVWKRPNSRQSEKWACAELNQGSLQTGPAQLNIAHPNRV